MVFASSIFLFWFLPLALGLYYAVPERARLWVLSAFSVLFYAWWRPDFVILMVVSSLIDFWAGGRLPKMATPRGRRGLLLLSLIANLGLLGYYKYANFGVETFNAILTSLGHTPVPWVEVVLPVGISFFTFQSMSYTIDIYRGEVQPIRSFLDFFAYVSMFPQLVAGPIVRFRDVAEQILHRTHSWSKLALGCLLFQVGFTKKVLLADGVAPLADQLFALADPGFSEAWIGTFAYTLQIYFDFSGYSDMAIGLGLMMGFVFPINFDAPYHSRSVTEFWRRWHISLGSWLRDYLYIPLGGNRFGLKRMYFALMTTMILGGLWHGDSWNFIAWGTYQGVWLVLERALGKRPFYSALPVPLQILLTFVITMGGWVLFKSKDLPQVGSIFAALAGANGGFSMDSRLDVSRLVWTTLLIGTLVLFVRRPSQQLVIRPSLLVAFGVPLLFLLAVGHLLFQQYRPFLYFQF